jgi:hypothetical protein
MVRAAVMEGTNMTTKRRLGSGGYQWTAADLRTLKRLARDGSVMAAAKALGRTPAAVQQKAMRSGIAFRVRRSRSRGTT